MVVVVAVNHSCVVVTFMCCSNVGIHGLSYNVHGHLISVGDAMAADATVLARCVPVLTKHGKTAYAVQGVSAQGWQRDRGPVARGREPARTAASSSRDAVNPADL